MLRPNLSHLPWILGGVEFGVNDEEPQVQFRVSCGVLRTFQSLYIKDGRFVDVRGDLEVVREIAM